MNKKISEKAMEIAAGAWCVTVVNNTPVEKPKPIIECLTCHASLSAPEPGSGEA